MPGARIDGNNVLEVSGAAGEAVARARRGDGPSLIECRTYRWLEHVGPHPDIHLGYRSEEELKEWMARCPLKTFKEMLLREGVMIEQDVDRMTAEVAKEIEEAVAYAKSSPFPGADELTHGVYAL
jgi:pyruvate dehydrogenase E1 component alpha subunit